MNKEVFIKRMTFHAEYYELEDLIQKVFKQTFSLVADQELKNDTTWSWEVTDKYFDEYDIKEVLNFFVTGNGTYIAQSLMDFMYMVGIIEPGEYVINISW